MKKDVLIAFIEIEDLMNILVCLVLLMAITKIGQMLNNK